MPSTKRKPEVIDLSPSPEPSPAKKRKPSKKPRIAMKKATSPAGGTPTATGPTAAQIAKAVRELQIKYHGSVEAAEAIVEAARKRGNIGEKPKPGDKDVYHLRVSNDITLRAWAIEATEQIGFYILDFIYTKTGEAVNAPKGYRMFAAGDLDLCAIPPGTKLVSVPEFTNCIPTPGTEYFLFKEGQRVKIVRPDGTSMIFETPRRPNNPEIFPVRFTQIS